MLAVVAALLLAPDTAAIGTNLAISAYSMLASSIYLAAAFAGRQRRLLLIGFHRRMASSTRARTGRVLTKTPIIDATPGTGQLRPARGAPNTTSLCRL
jgi:hypothetical protein